MGIDPQANPAYAAASAAAEAIPDTLIPPILPSMQSLPVRCACGVVIGLIDGPFYHSQHRDRDVHAMLPALIKCDRCDRHTAIDRAGRTKSLT